MGRGSLTEKVNVIAEKRIARKLSLGELRLIPYVQYVLVNEQRLDRGRIRGDEERAIIQQWNEEKFMLGKVGSDRITVTKKFWNFMCEVLFETYVNYEK